MRLIDADKLKTALCVRCMSYAECQKTGSELPVTCPWKKSIDEAPTVTPFKIIEFSCPTCGSDFTVNAKTNRCVVVPAEMKLID